MSCRHGCILLTMVAGLAPLGCAQWQPCWMREAPVMMTGAASGQAAPPPAAGAPGELTPAQAAQLCLTAGESLEKKGYTSEAIRQYENAREHDPQARVAPRLAVLYDLQGDNAHAEAEYVRALQEQPNDAELLNDLGYFHYRHDRAEVAEIWLRKAVAANPSSACAWTNLGQVLARRGRLEESYEAFAKVLRPAEAYSNLGVVLAKQGRTAEARQALQKALSLDSTLKQPQAFLNALPPAPVLLPPGITSKPTAPKPTVKVEHLPTILPPRAPESGTVSAPPPTPTPLLLKPVAVPAPLARQVTRISPTPMPLPRTPAPRPADADGQPPPPVTPPPPPTPRILETPMSPVASTPPPRSQPVATSKPKVDDDLPIILSGHTQPKPISTYSPPKASPKPTTTNATPPTVPRVLHLDSTPTVLIPATKPMANSIPQALLIDCSAPQDNPRP